MLGVQPNLGWQLCLNKKGKNLLDNATQNIKAIRLVVSDKKIFKFFEHLFCPCDLDVPFDQLF